MFRQSCHGAWCIFLMPLVIFFNGCRNVVLLPVSLSTVITSLVLAWRVIGPVQVSLVNGRKLEQNYRYDCYIVKYCIFCQSYLSHGKSDLMLQKSFCYFFSSWSIVSVFMKGVLNEFFERRVSSVVRIARSQSRAIPASMQPSTLRFTLTHFSKLKYIFKQFLLLSFPGRVDDCAGTASSPRMATRQLSLVRTGGTVSTTLFRGQVWPKTRLNFFCCTHNRRYQPLVIHYVTSQTKCHQKIQHIISTQFSMLFHLVHSVLLSVLPKYRQRPL